MPGMTILHYEFLEKIGSGGMGEVYRAHDKRLNRFVAIKALPYARSGDPERRKRFIQEAQTASSLSHPNIITIHDIFQEGDTHFLVMEYVAGRTLLELIPNTGMRPGQMLLYSVQMADALSAAHQAGIVHRDFKPANVMVTSSGLVKVLDFGLAKLTQPQTEWKTNASGASADSETVLIGEHSYTSGPETAEGSILGTVNYMSPEQAEGKKVDGRTDIFSLGAVMYEMLTGRRAFHGSSDVATLSSVLRDEVRPISELVPDVPHELEELINVCLRKDPNARWPTMKEVEMGLSGLKRRSDAGVLVARPAAQPPVAVTAKKAPAIPKPASSAGLRRILLLGAACVLLLLAAGTAWWFSLKSRSHPAPAAAAEVRQAIPEPAPTASVTAPPPAAPEQPEVPMIAAPPAAAPGIPAAPKKIAPPPPQTPQQQPMAGSTSASGQPATSTAAAQPKAAAPDTSRAPAQPASVTLADGLPFRIALVDDVSIQAQEQEALNFRAAEDVKAGDVLVIAKGATVTGEIVNGNGKKFLGMGSKMTFKLISAETVDGQKIPVRASVARRPGGPTVRPVDTGKYAKPKDVAAVRGTDYVAYIDGDQTITLGK